jgi:hypothetical protein
VSDSNYSRMHALECLRLASDCMQLARDVHVHALQKHFVRMAREWTSLAVQGSDANTQTERGYPD